MSATDAILLLAHGTVNQLEEMPAFLTSIRRGRPPSPELVQEMLHRYRAIGGSPHLEITRAQALALAERTGLSCEVAMRLWNPRVESVLPKLAANGIRRVCLLPLAPFSVDVYVEAARAAQASLEGEARGLELVPVANWGSDSAFVTACCGLIRRHLPAVQSELVLTAHSLPLRVIRAGDRYAAEFEALVEAVTAQLGLPTRIAYQSQGADGGEWLGPTLEETIRTVAQSGAKHITVAPIGFLSDHVETLYDLDIEAARWCADAGLQLTRVPALNTDPAFIDALAQLAVRALG